MCCSTTVIVRAVFETSSTRPATARPRPSPMKSFRRSDSPHQGGVPSLLAVQPDRRTDSWQRVGKILEQEKRDHWPAKASRSLPNTPRPCFCTVTSGRVSSRNSASWRRRSACSSSIRVGVWTSRVTPSCPRPLARSRGTPLPSMAILVPDWVPAGTESRTGLRLLVGILEVGLEGGDKHLGTKRCGRRRNSDDDLQIVAIAPEHLVRENLQFDIKIAGRPTTRPTSP